MSVGRQNKTHCKYGHSLKDAYIENYFGTKVRRCRECHKQRMKNYRAKAKIETVIVLPDGGNVTIDTRGNIQLS